MLKQSSHGSNGLYAHRNPVEPGVTKTLIQKTYTII